MSDATGRHAAPALRGGMWALAAALLFGLSTPLVQSTGRGVGAWSTAALLYAGAALLGALLRQPAGREARLRASDGPTLLLMAISGAALAPAALAWGLQHCDAAAAALLLTLEAVSTALLARVCFGERMDRRVWLAMLLLTAGGLTLVAEGRAPGTGSGDAPGLLAVIAATLAWGVDNTLSRKVAERDPGQVVMVKSGLGALLSGVLAAVAAERAFGFGRALMLLATGAIGYGLSLALYLRAQRSFGAGRTASVFATAPFLGAAAAAATGSAPLPAGLPVAAVLMAVGVVLHLAERHSHRHHHPPLDHEHAHRHDDGHHLHRHHPMPTGTHSHPHRHEPQDHAHAHVPDAHHRHPHRD